MAFVVDMDSAKIAEVNWLNFEVCYNLNYLCSLLAKLGLSYQKSCFINTRFMQLRCLPDSKNQ